MKNTNKKIQKIFRISEDEQKKLNKILKDSGQSLQEFIIENVIENSLDDRISAAVSDGLKMKNIVNNHGYVYTKVKKKFLEDDVNSYQIHDIINMKNGDLYLVTDKDLDNEAISFSVINESGISDEREAQTFTFENKVSHILRRTFNLKGV